MGPSSSNTHCLIFYLVLWNGFRLFFSSRIFTGFYIETISFLKCHHIFFLLIVSILSYTFFNIFIIIIPRLIPHWGVFYKLMDSTLLKRQDHEKKDQGTVPDRGGLKGSAQWRCSLLGLCCGYTWLQPGICLPQAHGLRQLRESLPPTMSPDLTLPRAPSPVHYLQPGQRSCRYSRPTLSANTTSAALWASGCRRGAATSWKAAESHGPHLSSGSLQAEKLLKVLLGLWLLSRVLKWLS